MLPRNCDLSSTETEVVSNSERFLKCMQFRYFRVGQEDKVKEDTLFQDNKSCIQFYQNYSFSARKGSKHANIKHFFVADKMEKKNVRMVHCETEEIVADCSTKLTQGLLFMHEQNLTLGLDEKEFDKCKQQCEAMLRKCELQDNEEDNLHKLQINSGKSHRLKSEVAAGSQ